MLEVPASDHIVSNLHTNVDMFLFSYSGGYLVSTRELDGVDSKRSYRLDT